ncbi:hypothetical protein [Halorubrum saccharovorum]|uniref:hypothetical protein n=1 Tax=Halorubrum saccharovorum TaxID=2248 RepID=UPI001910E7E8|nr:hypothetical protein [Halorubrum saccharovorum]
MDRCQGLIRVVQAVSTRFLLMIALFDSLLNEILFAVVEIGFDLTGSKLLDGFSVDDTPTSAFFDFMELPQPGLFFELKEPEPMSGPIFAAGECERGFCPLVLNGTPISIGGTSSIHTFYDMDEPFGRISYNP